jgi:glycerol 3-phosphatase-1
MGSLGNPPHFSAPVSTHHFDGLLFDFDGTIIDSTSAIVKHWHAVSADLGVDPNVILATSHGRRSIDVLQLYDPTKANWEYVSEIEGRIPRTWGADATETPGARKVLETMEAQQVPWAVVTSGTRALISGWLDVMKLREPKTMVVAEDVENGKPDPTCYLRGAQLLGMKAGAQVLVIEDAPSGVKAGKAAGFKVLGLSTTHSVESVIKAGADWVVRDLRSLGVVMEGGRVKIEITDALVW